MIYLDTAASYPLLSEVKEELIRAQDLIYANPSSTHEMGLEANNAINDARETLADRIGAYPSEIIFTSGATESNNIALKSLLLGKAADTTKKHVVTTSIEHKCILSICEYLETQGFSFTFVEPNKEGLIDPRAIKDAIQSNTALVSVMHVNNELGTINPIEDIGAICTDYGILFHSDAAQSLGKVGIDVDDLNVDLMSFSAHKIGGPKGIGALYIRDLRKRDLVPVIHGSGQEEGLRGGTVAAPLIIGFEKAVKHFPDYYRKFCKLGIKAHLIELLDKEQIPYQINGYEHALDSCISLTLPETNESLLLNKYKDEVCLSQGSACSSKAIEASHVLSAMGLSRAQADKTFRISFPLDITKEEISRVVSMIINATT